MSICYSIRLTPVFIDPSAAHGRFLTFFSCLAKTYDLDKYALCYEKKNKYGEDTYPHFHFNFETYASKEAIQAWVRRYPTFKIAGNKMYAVSRHPEPKDYDRWYRYCFKERILREHCAGFSEDEMDELELLAKDERARAVEYNCQKRERGKAKDTLFQRYSKIIREAKTKKDYKSIWLALLQCYKDEDRTINPQTIKGYSYLYQLKEGFITDDAFFHLQNPHL